MMTVLQKIFGTSVAIAIALTISAPFPALRNKQELPLLERRRKVALAGAEAAADRHTLLQRMRRT